MNRRWRDYRPFYFKFIERIKSMSHKKCWIWNGPFDRKGYGKVCIPRGETSSYAIAARVSYELFVNSIPKGKLVCHHCDNPKCVSPSHLFIGTYKDNMDDMMSKGRGNRGFWQKIKTHCKNGHEFTKENTRIRNNHGHRDCRACVLESANRRRPKIRAACREYARKNRYKIKQITKAYYLKNRKEIILKNVEYRRQKNEFFKIMGC